MYWWTKKNTLRYMSKLMIWLYKDQNLRSVLEILEYFYILEGNCLDKNWWGLNSANNTYLDKDNRRKIISNLSQKFSFTKQCQDLKCKMHTTVYRYVVRDLSLTNNEKIKYLYYLVHNDALIFYQCEIKRSLTLSMLHQRG